MLTLLPSLPLAFTGSQGYKLQCSQGSPDLFSQFVLAAFCLVQTEDLEEIIKLALNKAGR